MYIFDSKSSFRHFCVYIHTNKIYEIIIVVSIIANSIALAVTDYRDTTNYTQFNKHLAIYCDFFTWLFCVEAIINIVSLGFIGSAKAKEYVKNGKVVSKLPYIKDPWNKLDFIIVLSGVLSYLFQTDSQPEPNHQNPNVTNININGSELTSYFL